MAGNPEMEAAGKVAMAELLKAMEDMTDMERAGIRTVALWWKQNYLKAGHKNLAWQLMSIVK